MEYAKEGVKNSYGSVREKKKKSMYGFSFLCGNLIKHVTLTLEQHDFHIPLRNN